MREDADPAEHDRLPGWEATPLPEGAPAGALLGRPAVGPEVGFGPLWLKGYRLRLADPAPSPAALLTDWLANFGALFPTGTAFYAPPRWPEPGVVALVQLATLPGGGPLWSGLQVLQRTPTTLTTRNLLGHMFAAETHFATSRVDGVTQALVEARLRTSDPLWELSMRLGGFGVEDAFWRALLTALAERVGRPGTVDQAARLLDRRPRPAGATNLRHNAALSTLADRLTRRRPPR